MHPDLSPHLHTPECNKLIEELKSCHEQSKFAKFLGKCNQIDQQVVDCLRQERKNNQATNRQKALEKQQRVREKMRLIDQQQQ